VNVSVALAALFRLVRQTNYLMTQGRLFQEDAKEVLAALQAVDAALGILPTAETPARVSPEIEDLVRQRDLARKQGDFAAADKIRDRLAASGYAVEDSPKGTRIRRKG
jgi:cysteinyl-tRNA synthetase